MKHLITVLLLLTLHWTNSCFAGAGIATAHPLATAAGERILAEGGNAFDAAVAITAALAVVEPTGSGLGGGGFWLLHDAASGQDLMLDGREKAPVNATRDMYLDSSREVVPDRSIDGPLAAGIPGEPAALAWLSNLYGDLPLSQSLAPAIEYAEQGFEIGEHYQSMMEFREPVVKTSPAAAEIFLDQGNVPAVGWRLVQKDLAGTLNAIAKHGFDGFYRGEVAQRLVDGARQGGGVWTLDDLANYQVKVRKPITASYRGMKLISAALPSSGGLVMATALNILSEFNLNEMDKTVATHHIVEAMRRAYRDRAEFMGDMDFVEVPTNRLLSKGHADKLRNGIDPQHATKSSDLPTALDSSGIGTDTTHFSVVDHDGNRVAATLSINYPFGSGFVPQGTGVLLNDEMDDFSSKPGVPNVYGLVGGVANAIEPGKRMLSSMSPTFLETSDRIAVIGTPGGSRIISMVLLGALEFVNGGSAEDIVAKGRIHHQYLPDQIQYEPEALSPKEVVKLFAMGHSLKPRGRTWGNMHIVVVDKKSGAVSAASDPRVEGEARVIE